MEDDPYANDFMTSVSSRTGKSKCQSLKSMSMSSTAFTSK
jgi:hypothetical protein